ncbi:MAG: sigma-70 family RNA polymerase sigma factor [candidate division WOR-3 bacterium]
MSSQPGGESRLDAELVEQAKSGNLSAFEELVTRHQRGLYNFLFRMTGEVAAAEELTQTALVRAWTGLSGFRQASSFKTWLYRIGANLAMNYRLRTRPAEELTESIPAPESRQPEVEYLRHRRERIVREALSKLPADQRLALVLSVYEGQSYKEIAAVMKRSVRAVDSLLFRAKQNLRRLLQPARDKGIV